MEKVSRNKAWNNYLLGYFIFSVLFLCFFIGVVIGHKYVYPYEYFRSVWASVKQAVLHTAQPPFLAEVQHKGEGVVTHDQEKTFPGVTILTGFWPDGAEWNLGIRLIDLGGQTLHEWRMDPRDVCGQTPHHDRDAGSKDDKYETAIHGVVAFPNGDIIFNLEDFSLVKMNANSEVIWKVPYRTHHSVFQDDQGKIWTSGLRWREDKANEYPDLEPPFVEDTILKVSSDGDIEREINLLKVIYDSGYEGLIRGKTKDILHLNDVEVLSEQKAEFFDDFDAGDIMVSLRNINTIFVIDGKTERIKWSLTHPLIRQHDPDFTDDGQLIVFNNYRDKDSSPVEKGGTQILRINPSTKKITVLYGSGADQYFYTSHGGKQQVLPNQNMLITEARSGRVFEVTPKGEIVWDWHAPRWDENHVPEILDGSRYDKKYFNFLIQEQGA